jgi:hypothetical protein
MTRTLHWISCLLVALLLGAVGCRSQDQAAADSTSSGMLSPKDAKTAVGEITVGHQVGADGTIAADQKGNNFNPGQPVVIAFRIGEAPAGTLVTVDWYGPGNQELATDQKTVSKGESAMSFGSKDTSAWSPGDYHADITVGGQKVDSERFSIVAPDKADDSATKGGDAGH